MAYQKKGYPSTRPYQWVSGPDPETHAQYRAWVQQRNQAQWRGETWTITFDEFQQIWLGRWHLRGRGTEDLAMSRTDWTGPWSREGVELRTRKQLGQQQAAARARGHRSAARERELAQIAAAKRSTLIAEPQKDNAALDVLAANHAAGATNDARLDKRLCASSNYGPEQQEGQNG